jgi:hypothetical protein
MLVSTAAASVQFAQAAKQVLDANGATMLKLIYVNTSGMKEERGRGGGRKRKREQI